MDHLPAGVRDLSVNELSLVMNSMSAIWWRNASAESGQRSRCAARPAEYRRSCAASSRIARWRSWW